MEIFKVVGRRFLKGFFAGAVASGSVVTYGLMKTVHTWPDLSTSLSMLLLMAIVGGITGGLQALEKWYNYVPEINQSAEETQ